MKQLTIRGVALTVGLFFDVTFLLCAFWGFIVPRSWETMAKIWEAILPGFTWLTPGSVALGLVELFLYGVYVALVFVPLFNYFEGGGLTQIGKADSSGQSVGREAMAHH